ncbi:MAG: lytic transglycosylase domain-containing protein [Deltaproteobacteria bacterium]|nr:lytic transglycosylase domain-containing protein [Deltaproteobacteria bacterium]
MIKNTQVTLKTKKSSIINWRLCPVGQYWRKAHYQNTYERANGSIVQGHRVSAGCCKNPSGKDQMYPEEMGKIAKAHFSTLKNLPCELALKFNDGSAYDDLIAGWIQYWNNVFNSNDPLQPNLVKALIASESGFYPKKLADKLNPNSARGLSQITNDTRKILGDERGELKDHYLTLTKKDLNDPNINICAGIRWLFQKQVLASSKLGRSATWEEAVIEYKGLSKDLTGTNRIKQKRAQELMSRFRDYLERLQECKKS